MGVHLSIVVGGLALIMFVTAAVGTLCPPSSDGQALVISLMSVMFVTVALGTPQGQDWGGVYRTGKKGTAGHRHTQSEHIITGAKKTHQLRRIASM